MINDTIREKINNFYTIQRKVHITKTPSLKYPRGKFHNGYITEKLNDKLLFMDDVEGAIEIFFFEIADIELYQERDNGLT